jgi:hypothetical protein
MNGEDWYPAEYPPHNLERAIEAAKRLPGLSITCNTSTASSHAEFKAGAGEFELIFFLETEKHNIPYIFVQLSAGMGYEEIGINPLRYTGNGVPGSFEEFLQAALDETEEEEWADDPGGFAVEIEKPVGELKRRYGKLFTDFYETFLRTLHKSPGHHELYTEPYEENVGIEPHEPTDIGTYDESLMRLLADDEKSLKRLKS